MAASPFGQVISYGGVNSSIVLGLACRDCCENAMVKVGLDNIRLSKPVMHGDTLYAFSEVLQKYDAEQADAGFVVFRHHGYNQHDEQVAQVDRKVFLKRKSHWSGR